MYTVMRVEQTAVCVRSSVRYLIDAPPRCCIRPPRRNYFIAFAVPIAFIVDRTWRRAKHVKVVVEDAGAAAGTGEVPDLLRKANRQYWVHEDD